MTVVDLKVLDSRHGNAWPMPDYASDGAAGIDLRACLDDRLTLEPGAVELVGTGLALHLADPGLCAVILPRSGLGHRHGLVLGNLVGLIDSDYQGELKVSCWNRGNEPFEMHPGDRIAQLAIVPVIRPTFRRVDTFPPSARGGDGYGSTGRR